MDINLKDPESILELFDTIFSTMEVEAVLEIIKVLLCSSIASVVANINEPEKRYKMGEEGMKAFYNDVLKLYKEGRERADIKQATREAEEATKM